MTQIETEKTELPEETYKRLRRNYLFVYLLASLADWLQGPYLYRFYETYGYSLDQISFLYASGFASGAVSGPTIGHCADKFGRKNLCILYGLGSSLSCLANYNTSNFYSLVVARIVGGASSSILFSVFESWYMEQHLSRLKLKETLMAEVFAESSLYTGLLAILAGFLSFFLADALDYGPLAPFLLAVPVSLLSSYFCAKLWPEDLPARDLGPPKSFLSGIGNSLGLILFSKNGGLLLLGASQSIFETVLYIFVFLWSPVLEPLNFSNGLIFAIFMLCIMIGSAMTSSIMARFSVRKEFMLFASEAIATLAILGATVALYHQQEPPDSSELANWSCFVCFLVFEISVGIFNPSVAYVRGIVVPEPHRARVANIFRLPSNLSICLGISYIGLNLPNHFRIFACCTFVLVIALGSSFKFAIDYPRSKYASIQKLHNRPFVP